MKATGVIQPTAIAQPVANKGTRNTIPDGATGTHLASVKEGFPDITMQPLKSGGLPPMGEDFNGLFYLATDQKVYLQNGGVITFNQDVSDTIGGYPAGAVLDYVTSTGEYYKVKSLIDDNTYNFTEDSSYINDAYWCYLQLGSGNDDEEDNSVPELAYNIFCVNTGVIDSSGEPDFMNITQQLVIESTYSSDGISNFNVNTATYFDTATTYGDYVFTYSSGEWLLNDDAVTLSDYGITFTELFTASASYDSSGITGVELDEEQTLSALNKTAGTYNFVANIIEGNADERITYEYSSETITDVSLDTSVYFDNIDGAYVYNFKYKWDCITYEDSDGNLAENDIIYTDDDESTSTGSMYYVDESGDAIVSEIYYEDENGSSTGAWYIEETASDDTTSWVECTLSTYGLTVEGDPEHGDEIEVEVEELIEDSYYWTLSGSTVDLDDYGISYTGTPADNDIITVIVTSLLADGDTITVTVEDPEDEDVSQVYMLQTQGVFTVTIANGSSYTVSDQLTCSISDLTEGVYNVYIDPVNGEITVLDNNITAGIIMPSSAASSDYLLNISQIPYDLQSKSESGLTSVRAGILTISDLGKFLTLFRYNTNNLHGITNTVNQIGEPIVSLNSVLADNEIWLEGAEISCTSYPALYEVYGDTYGEASTDGYFVLPDFRGRVLQGYESEFGYVEAGLPNIYGTFRLAGTEGSSAVDGAFSAGTKGGTWGTGHDNKARNPLITLDASTYDSIYGSSDTVQPPAIRVRVKTRFI